MAHSHEEPVHCNSFRKVMPYRLISFRLGNTLSPLSTFFCSSLKIELIYPELCLLLDKTHRERKHAEASEKAAAVLSGLSFTVVIVWLADLRKLLCNNCYLCPVVSSICVKHNTHQYIAVSVELFHASGRRWVLAVFELPTLSETSEEKGHHVNAVY